METEQERQARELMCQPKFDDVARRAMIQAQMLGKTVRWTGVAFRYGYRWNGSEWVMPKKRELE